MAAFNVVSEYAWTVLPPGTPARLKAPALLAQSHKINVNELRQVLGAYIELAKQRGNYEEYYKKLYQTTKEDDFSFPFFNENVRSISNQFASTYAGGVEGNSQSIISGVAQEGARWFGEIATFIGELKAVAVNEPGVYIEVPKFYQYDSGSDGALQCTFTLLNTINDEDIKRNYELVKKLMQISRPERIDALTMVPPRIFKVTVPGYRKMEWACMSALNINLKGTKRQIGEKIIPEAYGIEMSFQSLTMEVSNFLENFK